MQEINHQAIKNMRNVIPVYKSLVMESGAIDRNLVY